MIPEELKRLDRWVCASNGSKCPMKAFEYKGAGVSRPDDWADYACARQSVENGVYDHVGFVFAGDGYVGIDIDCGFDEEGFPSALALDIIGACRSYTEESKSGRGVHIILRGALPYDGRNNGNGVEIYQRGRYFITTGRTILYTDIVENQPAIDYILDRYFRDVRESGPSVSPRQYSPVFRRPELQRINILPSYPEIGQGGRNQALASLAGQLRSAGFSKRDIYKELQRCNASACHPPLSAGELQQITDSIMRYER